MSPGNESFFNIFLMALLKGYAYQMAAAEDAVAF